MTTETKLVRRLGVENWTPEDFEREKVWRKACALVAAERRKLMVDLGWKFQEGRRYHVGNCSYGTWAMPPEGEGELPYREAEARLEKEQPGLLPAFPPRPEFPPSTEGLFEMGEVEIKPMVMPSGSIFYDRVRALGKAQIQAEEDKRIFAALDALAPDKK